MYFSIIPPPPLPFLSIAKQKWARWLWPPAQTCTVPCVSGDRNPVICADITYHDACEADPTYIKILPSHTMAHVRLTPPKVPNGTWLIQWWKCCHWKGLFLEKSSPVRTEGRVRLTGPALPSTGTVRTLHLLHLTLTPGGTGERSQGESRWRWAVILCQQLFLCDYNKTKKDQVKRSWNI